MNFILISEVETEWNFCRSYIIRYEVIWHVKLRYFSLIFDEFTKITEVCRMMPIEKVKLNYAKCMSISYKISWGIQKWTLLKSPKLEPNESFAEVMSCDTKLFYM